MKLLPLEKQIRSRKTYYSFLDKPVSQDKIDILLRNADGATPALCDQYDYRVDIWPDHLKQILFKTSILDITQEESTVHKKAIKLFEQTGSWKSLKQKYGDRICVNPQVFAPVVLAFSQPCDPKHDFMHEATTNAMAFQMWHLVQLSQDLGLDHAFCRGFDACALKEQIQVSRYKGPNVGYYFPHVFLCIGYGDLAKHNVPRPKPGKGILNTLRFKANENR